jgi:TolB-like protein
MKTINLKPFAVQALALLLFAGAATAADYKSMAANLALAARSNGITRVALGAFSGDRNEASFAEEKISVSLAGEKDLEVLDQDALQASAGTKEGWMKNVPSKMRPQAFIKGSVFQDGDDLTIMVKLVDARSGRVLKAVEMKAQARFSDIPSVPDINWSEPVAMAPMANDFRDAPADNGFNCEASFREMTRLNTAALDLKARYWARKMKEPGFAIGSLSRNPGSEIKDYQLKQQFYELLSKYHDQDEAPALPEAQAKKLEAFMQKEDTVIDRCGLK